MKDDHRTRVGADRRAQMRQRLLEAALFLVAEHGPQSLTIDGVIAKAGVSRGTFYKYYSSAQELVADVAAKVSDALIKAHNPLVQNAEDHARGIAYGFRAILEFVRICPVLGHFLVRAGWPVLDLEQGFFKIVADNIKTAIDTGRFVRIDAETAINLTVGLTLGTIQAMLVKDLPPGFIHRAAIVLLRGLGISEEEAASILAAVPTANPDFSNSILQPFVR